MLHFLRIISVFPRFSIKNSQDFQLYLHFTKKSTKNVCILQHVALLGDKLGGLAVIGFQEVDGFLPLSEPKFGLGH